MTSCLASAGLREPFPPRSLGNTRRNEWFLASVPHSASSPGFRHTLQTPSLFSATRFLPLSCGHHSTAFRVIPFFRRASIAPAAFAVLFFCIPPARQRIFCHFGIPEHSHVCSTGHCPWVSSWFFPNAGIPTAPPAESFRLSERLTSRLCTEFQDSPEGFVSFL